MIPLCLSHRSLAEGFSNLNNLYCLKSDKFSVKELIGQIPKLVKGSKFLGKCADTDGPSADYPVIAEITEGEGFEPDSASGINSDIMTFLPRIVSSLSRQR